MQMHVTLHALAGLFARFSQAVDRPGENRDAGRSLKTEEDGFGHGPWDPE